MAHITYYRIIGEGGVVRGCEGVCEGEGLCVGGDIRRGTVTEHLI